jgi:hypothetical protein
MVQVDVFWSYGLASGLTLAAVFGSPVFWTLIAMGVVLVPTYAYLCVKWRRAA